MSEQQLQKARQLIQEKRYAEARQLLKTIDHPKAREWLAKLPPDQSRSGGVPVPLFVLGLLIALLVGAAGGYLVGRQSVPLSVEQQNLDGLSAPDEQATLLPSTDIPSIAATATITLTPTPDPSELTSTAVNAANATAIIGATQTADASQ